MAKIFTERDMAELLYVAVPKVAGGVKFTKEMARSLANVVYNELETHVLADKPFQLGQIGVLYTRKTPGRKNVMPDGTTVETPPKRRVYLRRYKSFENEVLNEK